MTKATPVITRHTPGVKAYFCQTSRPDGQDAFMYLLSPEAHESALETAIANGDLPRDAVVLQAGVGQPDAKTVFDMELYFGIKPQDLLVA